MSQEFNPLALLQKIEQAIVLADQCPLPVVPYLLTAAALALTEYYVRSAADDSDRRCA